MAMVYIIVFTRKWIIKLKGKIYGSGAGLENERNRKRLYVDVRNVVK